jgi:hypothetical protein
VSRQRGEQPAAAARGTVGQFIATRRGGAARESLLVDFWEYTCVNWIRTSPYVKAWNRVYAPFGLVVIGVHAPEF